MDYEIEKQMLKYTLAPAIKPKQKLINTIKDYFNISEEQLKSRKRDRILVVARSVYVMFCRNRLGMTVQAIGKDINLHHSSVIYIDKKYYTMMETDVYLSQCYYDISNKVGAIQPLSAYIFDINANLYLKETPKSYYFKYSASEEDFFYLDKRFVGIEDFEREGVDFKRLIIQTQYAYIVDLIKLRDKLPPKLGEIMGERLGSGELYMYPKSKFITHDFVFRKLKIGNHD